MYINSYGFELHLVSVSYDTRSLSPRKCSANILRTSSFQCIYISESDGIHNQAGQSTVQMAKLSFSKMP